MRFNFMIQHLTKSMDYNGEVQTSYIFSYKFVLLSAIEIKSPCPKFKNYETIQTICLIYV